MNLGLGNLGNWRFLDQSFCLLLLFSGIDSLVIGVVDIIGTCSSSSNKTCGQDDLTDYNIDSVEKSYFQPCVSNKKKIKNSRFSLQLKPDHSNTFNFPYSASTIPESSRELSPFFISIR